MINENKINNKDYSNLRDEANIKKYMKFGEILARDIYKNSDNKLINLKTNTGKNIHNKEVNKNVQNFISFPVTEKNISFLTINNNTINIKKSDIQLPNLNQVAQKQSSNSLEKHKSSSLCNEATSRWIQKLTLNTKNNFPFFNKNSLINKEENKARINSNDNKIFTNQDLSNINNNKNFMKITKKFKFHKINRTNTKFETKTTLRNHNMTPSSSTRIIHPILGLKKIPSHTLSKCSSQEKLKKFISNNSIDNSKERDDKLSFLNSIFKTKGNNTAINFKGVIPFKKKVKLSSEIFRNNYKNFNESITSKNEDIFDNDIIKGFAYNTSMGNIRSYNEDEICVSKLFFNNNKDKYDINNKNCCHFFAIYDGHGGKGCATFLKENLHKFISEFSFLGMKIGIDMAEEKFLTKKAVNELGKIIDQSGSCGIMLMIQGKKCIIANIGDSRLIIFKNKEVSFTTTDHKPDSIIEKARIELSGGKLYKIQTLIPIYQNGSRVNAPWRVNPGQLSVSRTFGDIQAKDEKFGGNKTAIIALPDITEIELDDNYNFILMACDGIFDVLKNEELLECIKIVIKEKNITNFKDVNMHQLCGDFADMIIKSALAKDSFDNVSCIVIAINLDSLSIDD